MDEVKQRKGRPPKKIENLMIHRIAIKLTKGEYLRIKEDAEKEGLSISDFLRRLASTWHLSRK